MMTNEYVKKMFNYNPETGLLTWATSPKSAVKVGDEAGWITHKGRRRVMIKEKIYSVANIIWFWVTGSWPKYEIDHIDRNKLNNKWDNLRDVPHLINGQNRSVSSNSSSGVSGVTWDKNSNKWVARIVVKGDRKFLGRFLNFEEAVKIRKEAEKVFYLEVVK